jgi:hypothetical protein
MCPDCGRDNLDHGILLIEMDMVFQDNACTGIRLKGYHTTPGADPCGKLESPDADVRPNIQAGLARKDFATQEGCHRGVVIAAKLGPKARVNPTSGAVDFPWQADAAH